MKSLAKFNLQTNRHPYVVTRAGKIVLTTDSDSRQCVILDGRLQELGRIGPFGGKVIERMALSPGCDLAALAFKDDCKIFNMNGKLHSEWPTATWNEWSGQTPAFSPDGRFLWMADPKHSICRPTILIVDLERMEFTASKVVDVPEQAHLSFVFQPNGKTVALVAGAGQDGQWTYFCKLGRTLSIRHVEDLDNIPLDCFHPDGKEFVCSSMMDGIVQRRRFRDAAVLAELRGNHDLPITPCFFISDSLIGMAGEEELFVVDYPSMTLQERVSIELPQTWLTEIKLFALNRLLAVHVSETQNYSLRLWDARTKIC